MRFFQAKLMSTLLAAEVIKFTSCLSTVGGSLRVVRFLPPLKLVELEKTILFIVLFLFCFLSTFYSRAPNNNTQYGE